MPYVHAHAPTRAMLLQRPFLLPTVPLHGSAYASVASCILKTVMTDLTAAQTAEIHY